MSKKRGRLRRFIQYLIDRYVDFKVYNRQYAENMGAGIAVTNHISRLDVVFLMFSLQRTDLIPLAASNYRKVFFFNWVLRTLRVIWVNRGEPDFVALRAIQSFIDKGWIVGLAPEGTRSRSGKLIEAKSGVVLMAQKAQVPIVPVGITGSADMKASIRHWEKMKVTINIGEPFYLPTRAADEDMREYVKRATDEIMCRIAILLPEEMRGHYAKHPLIEKLLQTTDQSKNPIYARSTHDSD